MFASLVPTALLLSGQAGSTVADADGLDASLFYLSLGCVVFGALCLLVKFFPVSDQLPQSKRRSHASAVPRPDIPRSRGAEPAAESLTHPALRPIPRRVIRLHAVTPGQSRYEYNVGDRMGTRASALAQMA